MRTKRTARDTFIRWSYRFGVGSIVQQIEHRRSDGPLFRVVVFHEIKPGDERQFEMLLKLLKEEYRIVSIEDMISETNKSQFRETDAGPFVAITFDDGFASWMDIVVPRLRERDLPATFFVTSGFIDAESAGAMHKFARTRLKLQPTESLSWDDVRELHTDSLFTIGGHTRRHADLGTLSSSEISDEILDDADRIASEIGETPNLFAYPFGTPWNAPQEAKDPLKAAGYEAAFTIEPGFNTSRTDSFRLYRDSLTLDISPQVVQARIAGAYDPFKRMLDAARLFARKN